MGHKTSLTKQKKIHSPLIFFKQQFSFFFHHAFFNSHSALLIYVRCVSSATVCVCVYPLERAGHFEGQLQEEFYQFNLTVTESECLCVCVSL